MRIFFLGVSMLFLACNDDGATKPQRPAGNPVKPAEKPLPYEAMKRRIDGTRLAIRQRFLKAKDSGEKNKALAAAGNRLLQTIGCDLYVYWQGTPWDFNGTTAVPKEGVIACGYFVNGLLQDAGCRLNRIRLSTCPSLSMMKELTAASAVKNLSRLKFGAFEEWIRNSGKGVYIAGLDHHTGFIVNDGTEAWFIHSNYINKAGVCKERLNESAALRASETRYVTNLTGNEKFLRAWLLH